MILMCKNQEVYNIEKQLMINKDLAPGILKDNPTHSIFRQWCQSRYSSQTNVTARLMQGRIFGQGNRQEINRVTRSLSLSDCYWLKSPSDDVKFEEVSPYFNDFWTGTGIYKGQSVPTLYTDGMLPKYWENCEWLVKQSSDIEYHCYMLCVALELEVAEVRIIDDKHIAVRNFTSPDIMFEAADTSGRVDVADVTQFDVIEVFGTKGLYMLILDAIVGNIDRHTGNYGFLRNANSGQYIQMAPLFDFDHALGELPEDDYFLIKALYKTLSTLDSLDIAVELAEKVVRQDTLPQFVKRAEYLLNYWLK